MIWRSLLIFDIFLPFAGLWQIIANLDIGINLQIFLLTGIIPGTSYEISFYHIVSVIWILLIYKLGNKLYKLSNNSLGSFKLYK